MSNSKTQFMANLVASGEISLYRAEIDRRHYTNILTITFALIETIEQQRSRKTVGKLRDVLRSDIFICLKREIVNQCICTCTKYMAKPLTLIKKTGKEIQVTKRAMKRLMLSTFFRDKILNNEVKRTAEGVDIVRTITLKWKWAEHIAKMTHSQKNPWIEAKNWGLAE